MFRNVIFHNSWKVTPVAPRNAHDVSYVARIKHVSHFSWQGQHLVTLECFFVACWSVTFRRRRDIW